MPQNGLFVGLTTLDIIYLAAAPPQANQKIVASDRLISAGGPATNAAITFVYLSKQSDRQSQSKLITSLGSHDLVSLIKADLNQHGVEIIDLDRDRRSPPPMSSIVVSESTGERAVISINATKRQIPAVELASLAFDPLTGIDIVLIDGHQMALGQAIAKRAQAKNIPVVVDGGSWKPGFEKVLSYTDYAICSSNFYPPGCQSESEVYKFLTSLGVPHIAITKGADSISCRSNDRRCEVLVPSIEAVDTLGAGDIFHGAFCHYLVNSELKDQEQKFMVALKGARAIASRSCQFFGTRKWMMDIK
jgi:sugar/nucleoside kinase (ribokinase family)